jgi:catechol 2,3-dioxygenase-like lactoylglutathione lyase family enzyme
VTETTRRAAVLGLPTVALAGRAEAAQAVRGGLMVKRVALLVADVDRSIALFRDILGFTLVQDKRGPDSPDDEKTFNIPKGSLVRTAKLNTSDEQIRVLGLFQVAGYKGRDRAEPHDQGLVIRVNRIDDIHAKLKAAGYAIINFKNLTTSDGDKGRELFFLDADGHLIVCYEILPAGG